MKRSIKIREFVYIKLLLNDRIFSAHHVGMLGGRECTLIVNPYETQE